MDFRNVSINKGNGKEPLGDEVALLMGGKVWIMGINDELVDAFDKLDFLLNLPEQNGTGVGGELPPIEVHGNGLDFVRPDCDFR